MNERDVFIAAIQKETSAEKNSYLDRACSGDTALRANVEDLLREHDHLGSFLESPAPQLVEIGGHSGDQSHVGAEPPSGRDEMERRVLGDFRIIREIGRGGMGVVYEAEQISLGRRMALKVLPFASVLDDRQLQRFKREAQAAAHLKHPNIVGVHSVGCERGVHYYAMEYIEGQTLEQVVRELRVSTRPGESVDAGDHAGQLAESLVSGRLAHPTGPSGGNGPATDTPNGPSSPAPSPPLSPSADTRPEVQAALSTVDSVRSREFFHGVARLGIQAARALDYAHEMGVVHRDVKPANLMVDAKGHLSITDFGLALTQADADLTMTGDIVGTLRYMSPEQLAGGHGILDHRTDVYSLGATLYELLTQRPVCNGKDRQVLTRQVTEEEPRQPRQINRAIPVDLETIVTKALAKEAPSRYGSAGELADDLQRFVEDKPIRAKRPSLVERSAKWSRRHQVLVRSSLVILLLATVGLAIGAVLIGRAYRAESIQRIKAEEEKARADAHLKLARKAVGDMYTQVAEQWLERQPYLTVLQSEFLLKAASFYEKVSTEESDDPVVLYETAQAQNRLGVIYNKTGKHAKAMEACEKAIRVLRNLIAECPEEADYRELLAETYTQSGSSLRSLSRYQQAHQAYLKAWDVYRELSGDFPQEPNFQCELAATQMMIGQVCPFLPRSESAEVFLRDAVNTLRQLAAAHSQKPRFRQCLAEATMALGQFLLNKERFRESEEVFRDAMEVCQKLSKEPAHRVVSRMLLGDCYRCLGRVLLKRISWQEINDEAENALREAVTCFNQLAAEFPDVPEYRRSQAYALLNLGKYLWKNLRYDEALPEFRRSRDLFRRLVNEFPKLPRYQTGLASACYLVGTTISMMDPDFQDPTTAVELAENLRTALALRLELAAESVNEKQYQGSLGACHHNLGIALAVLGRFNEAHTHLQTSLSISERLAAEYPNHDRVSLQRAYSNMAKLLTHPDLPDELKDPQRAIRCATRAVEIGPELEFHWWQLSIAHIQAGDRQAAFEIAEKIAEREPYDKAYGWLILADAHLRLDHDKEARQWYSKSVEWIKAHNATDPELLQIKADLTNRLGLTDGEPSALEESIDLGKKTEQ